MPGTDANNQCSAGCICLRFCQFLTKHFYVKVSIIIIDVILAITFWAEFSWEHPATYYFSFLVYFLLLSFIEKGCFDGKICLANRTAYKLERQESQQRRREQRSAEQLRQGGQRSRPSWMLGEQPQAAAAPEPMVEIHHPYEPSESPSPNEPEPANEPLQPAEHSDSDRNVPLSIAGPSTQSVHNMPMDVRNENAQIDVPSQQTESSGINVPQSSSNPYTQSNHSAPLNVSKEEPRNDKSLQQTVPSDSGSKLPQSSTDLPTQSTSSAPSDEVSHEEHRSDESLQAVPSDSGSNLPQSSNDQSSNVTNEGPRSDESLQVMPSDLGSNVPQSSTVPFTQSTGSASLDDVGNEETRKD